MDFSTRTGDPPCPGDPVPNPEITSSGPSGKRGGTFGCTRSDQTVCDGVSGKKRHDGLDINAEINSPLYATHSGKVQDIRNSFSYGEYKNSSYGNYITIQTTVNGKTYFMKYNHLNRVDVIKGQNVSVGDVIGLNGNTGNANPPINPPIPHIHIQVYDSNWKSINPINFLTTKFDSNFNPITKNCN